MKIFKNGNWKNDKCPICHTSTKGKVVLVGIIGTEEGFNMQAKQIHLDCIDLLYDKKLGILYQKL